MLRRKDMQAAPALLAAAEEEIDLFAAWAFVSACKVRSNTLVLYKIAHCYIRTSLNLCTPLPHDYWLQSRMCMLLDQDACASSAARTLL